MMPISAEPGRVLPGTASAWPAAIRFVVDIVTRRWEEGRHVLIVTVPRGIDLGMYEELRADLADVVRRYEAGADG